MTGILLSGPEWQRVCSTTLCIASSNPLLCCCVQVIVYHYPKEIKAFYMKLNEDGRTVAAMDVLVPKVGDKLILYESYVLYESYFLRVQDICVVGVGGCNREGQDGEVGEGRGWPGWGTWTQCWQGCGSDGWMCWSPRWVFPFRFKGRLCYLVSVGHWFLQQL